MKRLALWVAPLLFTTGLALAQDTTPTTGSGTHAFRVKNPAIRNIFEQFKSQKERIADDVKTTKLTSQTATPLNDKLKSIGQEMRTDFKQNKQNGTKGLTNDQIQQINQELATNSAAIP